MPLSVEVAQKTGTVVSTIRQAHCLPALCRLAETAGASGMGLDVLAVPIRPPRLPVQNESSANDSIKSTDAVSSACCFDGGFCSLSHTVVELQSHVRCEA